MRGKASRKEDRLPLTPEQWSDGLYECLLAILRELGWYGSRDHLNKVLPIKLSPMKFEDIINSMAALRIAVEEKNLRLNDLDAQMLPCIFVGKDGYPLVLLEYNEFGLSAYDGVSKKKQVIKPDRRKGSALFLKFIEEESLTLFDSIPNWFMHVSGRFRTIFNYSMVVSFAINLLTIFAPILVMFLFSEIEALENRSSIDQLAVGVGIYVCTLFGFRIIRTLAQSYVSSRVGNIVGNQVMRRLFYLPPAYTEMASLGAQLSRIKDFDTIKSFISGSALASLMELPFTFIIVAILLLIDPRTAFVPIGALGVFAVFWIIARYWSKGIGGKYSGSTKEYNDFVMDTLANLRVVKSLALSSLWVKKYRKLLASSIILNLKSSSFHSAVSQLSSALVSLAGLATVFVGVQQIIAGEMTPAGLMASVMLTWRVLAPIKTGFAVAIQFDKVKKSVDQVNRLMEIQTEKRSSDSVAVAFDLVGEVNFSQVSLRYKKDAHPAILGVSFTVQPKETLVVIGHGGSGTSSILRLVMGMYLPQTGRVIIDGNNLQQIDPLSLRRQIAYLPEKPFFFSGTLKQNLLLTNPLATEDDLFYAINESGLQEEINALPLGLDSPFDDASLKNYSLSFQRRFSLALMLIKESNLWLLDSPGVGLEDIHERRVLSALEGARGLATIIIATQNPDYLRLADKILWLEGGRMKSFGTLEQINKSMRNLDVA